MWSTIVRTVLGISLALVAGAGVVCAQDEGITVASLVEAVAQITGRVDGMTTALPPSKRLSRQRQYRQTCFTFGSLSFWLGHLM